MGRITLSGIVARKGVNTPSAVSRGTLVTLLMTTALLAQALEFDVATIKPNTSGSPRSGTSVPPAGRFEGTNVTLVQLLERAYDVREFQVSGGPDWIRRDRFDVIGKTPDAAPPNRIPDMLRALLADRFKVVAHRESREQPVYALTVARADGKPAAGVVVVDCDQRPGYCGNTSTNESGGAGTVKGSGMTMKQLAEWAGNRVDRAVIDRTGLSGNYDFELRYASPRLGAAAPPEMPSLFTALQEQLGLKLENARGPVEFLVIDRADHPTPD